MSEIYQIAIDGPSGSGKSTLAKGVSKVLGIMYLDTGAMYRTCGLSALKRGISPKDEDAVKKMLEDMSLDQAIDAVKNVLAEMSMKGEI